MDNFKQDIKKLSEKHTTEIQDLIMKHKEELDALLATQEEERTMLLNSTTKDEDDDSDLLSSPFAMVYIYIYIFKIVILFITNKMIILLGMKYNLFSRFLNEMQQMGKVVIHQKKSKDHNQTS